jgi:hypothetical protein
MESSCQLCSGNHGEKLCQIKLKELFDDYDKIKGDDFEFAEIGESFAGRLLQYHQIAPLEEFLKV